MPQKDNDQLVSNLFKPSAPVKRQCELTMQPAPPFQAHQGQTLSPELRQILRGVSRSFDLSIRLLPPALQAPVAIGYLLARATDTVADTTALPIGQRQELLDNLTLAIGSTQRQPTQTAELARQTQAFAQHQSNPHERALMLALPQCWPLLHTLSQADQASVRQVLGHITRGQQLDMARFGPGLNALHTEAELQDYTWLVAGCVGEFWTELCGRHLPGYSLLPQADMLRIGREYGMGLQRLNIVRDAGADLASGRCYWPVETLALAGLTPALLAEAAHTSQSHSHSQVQHQNPAQEALGAATLQALSPLYTQWLDHTQAQLACGLRYALALKPWRLRLASALPALIGARTVALLRQTGPAALGQSIKMPRRELRALLWRIALGLGSTATIERQFHRLSAEPPI
jgi:farnesyl-diphosphate farnesyltransferase